MAKRFDGKEDRDFDRRPQGPRKGVWPKRQGSAHSAPRPADPKPQPTSWEHVADWYDKLVGDEGSDYHRNVVLPAAMRLLAPRPGQKILDLCCGQGVLSRLVAAQYGQVQVVGVDVSPSLISAAKDRFTAPNVRFEVGDARNLGPLADGSFDSVACIMAVQDMDDLKALFKSVSASLKPGGSVVIIMMHPCFRIPRQSSWGFDNQLKTQFRRIDRYATPIEIPIATHPGSDPSQHTRYFHRPLATYISTMGQTGLAVTDCEELISHRLSEPGGRSRAENRSRREIPIFLALKAIKLHAK